MSSTDPTSPLPPSGSATRFLLSVAALLGIAFGIQFFRPVLIPLLLALVVATGSQPVVDYCSRRGLSPVASATAALLVVLACVSAVVGLLVYAANNLSQELPTYEGALRRFQGELASYLTQHHVERVALEVAHFDAGSATMSGATGSIASLASVLTNALLVYLFAAFVLFERAIFEKKLALAFHFDRVHKLVDGVFSDVQHYLWIKTWFGVITGVSVGVWCALWHLPNPALWGLLTFALNFAPMVGCLIASIPQVAIALLLFGPVVAAMFGLGLGVIHLILGSIVEPRVMGRRLGLSPLVVFSSMLVWGFLLGPVGALLSTPLTMMFKIAVSRSANLRWIGILLGDFKETTHEAAVRAPPPPSSKVCASDVPTSGNCT